MTSYAYSSIFVVAMLKFETERTLQEAISEYHFAICEREDILGGRAMQRIFLGNSLKEEVINLSIT